MKVYQHLHAANHIANYTELNMAETNFKPDLLFSKQNQTLLTVLLKTAI